MPYQIEFQKSGQDILFGLVNHDHNPYGLPHQDAWSKVVIAAYAPELGYNLFPEASLIVPTYPWEEENSDFIVKKEIGFETNSCRIKIHGDDDAHIYIDGELKDSSWGWNAIGDHTYGIEPGMHTIAIRGRNVASGGFLEFVIYDGDDIIDVSDTSWGYYEPIKAGVPDVECAKKGWHNITDANVQAIKPPEVVPDGTVVNSGSFDKDDIAINENYGYKFWPKAVIHTPSSFALPHPSAKRISATANYNINWQEVTFRRLVNITSGTLKFRVNANQTILARLDGAWLDEHANKPGVQEYTRSVTPGLHMLEVRVSQGFEPPAGAAGAWAVYDNNTLIDVSDTSWACREANVHGYVQKNAALISYVIQGDESHEFNWTGTNEASWVPDHIVEYEDLGNGAKRVNNYLRVDNYGANWDYRIYKTITPKDTKTVIRTLDPQYGVKDVTIHYNRIPIDQLFSVSGLAVPEINVESTNGNVTLNQQVLDEINRRYGVNFILDDFSLYKSGNQYTLQAKGESLVFQGICNLDIMHALDTRVPNKTLVGFSKNNVILN